MVSEPRITVPRQPGGHDIASRVESLETFARQVVTAMQSLNRVGIRTAETPQDGKVLVYDAPNKRFIYDSAIMKILTTKGDLLTHDGADCVRLPIGTTGQVLTVSAGGEAAWTAPAAGFTPKVGFYRVDTSHAMAGTVKFDQTIIEDTSNYSMDNATGVLTINADGLYRIEYCVIFAITTGTGGSEVRGQVKDSGSAIAGSQSKTFMTNTTWKTTFVNGRCLRSLSASDTVTADVVKTSGFDNHDVLADSALVVELVR